MNEHSPPGASHTEYCIPSTKPDNCVQESWNKLLIVFHETCPENGSPPIIGGIDSITPAYLSVPKFEACLHLQYFKENHFTSHSEYCLPQNQPINCYNDSWDQLNQMENSRLEKCAPQDFLG